MSSSLLTDPLVVPSELTKGSASTCGRSGEGKMLSAIRSRVGKNETLREGGREGARERGEEGKKEEGGEGEAEEEGERER